MHAALLLVGLVCACEVESAVDVAAQQAIADDAAEPTLQGECCVECDGKTQCGTTVETTCGSCGINAISADEASAWQALPERASVDQGYIWYDEGEGEGDACWVCINCNGEQPRCGKYFVSAPCGSAKCGT